MSRVVAKFYLSECTRTEVVWFITSTETYWSRVTLSKLQSSTSTIALPISSWTTSNSVTLALYENVFQLPRLNLCNKQNSKSISLLLKTLKVSNSYWSALHWYSLKKWRNRLAVQRHLWMKSKLYMFIAKNKDFIKKRCNPSIVDCWLA